MKIISSSTTICGFCGWDDKKKKIEHGSVSLRILSRMKKTAKKSNELRKTRNHL